MNAHALRIAHGIHDWMTSSRFSIATGAGMAAGMVEAESSWTRKAADRPSTPGCPTFSSVMRHIIDTMESKISTSVGPWKFDIRNCVTANDTPDTRIAGQIWIIPGKTAKDQISQNGTSTEKNGSWRQTIAPSLNGSRPVAAARPAIGAPRAPYATGAVLAMRE